MSANFFNIKIKYITFIKFLFYAFPIFILMPSGYITVYVTILTGFSLIFFYFNNIKIKFELIDYFIFLFFLSSLISTLINIKILGYYIFFKSILALRFVLFFFVIRNLIKFKFVDIKILFLAALLSTSFLSLDIIYQHINGQDLFGNKPFDGRFNGIFEHEAIAGSYIQKFYIISLSFLLLSNFNNKFFFLTMVINILGMGILLSLDRMPFLVYLFINFLLIILLKKYRLVFIINLCIIFFLFIFLFNNYDQIRNRYSSLNNEINFSQITLFLKDQNINDKKIDVNENNKFLSGDYYRIYKSVYYLWTEAPIVGSGVKSFTVICNKLLLEKKDLSCSTHPHNIYLEIITNQGLLGLSIFILFIAVIIISFVRNLTIKNLTEQEKLIIILFSTILIAELWPLRSYGSIFQTVNGSIFWFFLSLISSKK